MLLNLYARQSGPIRDLADGVNAAARSELSLMIQDIEAEAERSAGAAPLHDCVAVEAELMRCEARAGAAPLDVDAYKAALDAAERYVQSHDCLEADSDEGCEHLNAFRALARLSEGTDR